MFAIHVISCIDEIDFALGEKFERNSIISNGKGISKKKPQLIAITDS